MPLTYEMIGIEHRQRRTSVLGDAELVRAAQNGDANSRPRSRSSLRRRGPGVEAENLPRLIYSTRDAPWTASTGNGSILPTTKR
jgi:hypothetical protein